MAKKSAASMKPKHAAEVVEIDVEKKFEEAKTGLVTIIEAQIRNCDRIDNLWDTYEEIRISCEDDSIHKISFAQDACNEMVDTYKKLLDIVKGLELSTFTADNYVDPIAHLVPSRMNCAGFKSMYLDYVIWRCIRPVGEKLEQLYMTVKNYNPLTDIG